MYKQGENRQSVQEKALWCTNRLEGRRGREAGWQAGRLVGREGGWQAGREGGCALQNLCHPRHHKRGDRVSGGVERSETVLESSSLPAVRTGEGSLVFESAE